ncbi:hypothetical protein [Marinoscillum sp. MHG1-6]|uniref:hypothetical protein n=1 Tax=Marinoscillum sp. MHG1-6 TaxID=2959627 RepID=UPI002156FB43|nr:hypothetical protein [Marinoscillum sp. MHG1-6]
MSKGSSIYEQNNVDLLEVVNVIWLKRNFLLKWTGVFLLLGFLIAFTTPNEYKTFCTLIPENNSSQMPVGGPIGGIASLAGFNLGSMTGDQVMINPRIYGSVAQSTPFLMSLLSERFYFPSLNDSMTLNNYYLKHYKKGILSKIVKFPFTILNWLNKEKGNKEFINEMLKEDLIVLTEEQQKIVEDLLGRIQVDRDEELGVIKIEVEMQDPMVAAKIVRFTKTYITEYLENYVLSKKQNKLKYVSEQYQNKKQEFERAQMALAVFRDRNQYVNTSRAKSEEEGLEASYNLAFSVFDQLAREMEQVMLEINEDKPVFTVLEPTKVPLKKASPKRLVMLLIALIAGFLSGSGFVFVTNLVLPSLREELKV